MLCTITQISERRQNFMQVAGKIFHKAGKNDSVAALFSRGYIL